ncbi:MAG: DUF3368 domain-containing protein [Chloroflexi bacterium]|nr:DUF3368 domain-containing protein [Chloroflexota bacterium]
MPDLICDTSPIQYLYQLGLLHVLPALATKVFVPPSVVEELRQGRALGVPLPNVNTLNWVTVQRPTSESATVLVTDLGPGETEVLMLGLELSNAVVVLDDALARRIATMLELPLTGTLGLLLDAKRAGLISSVAPFLNQLESLRFRLAHHTRVAVLELAGEQSK